MPSHHTAAGQLVGTVNKLNYNPFNRSVSFRIETSHLFCRPFVLTGFYMKCNKGLKCVNSIW